MNKIVEDLEEFILISDKPIYGDLHPDHMLAIVNAKEKAKKALAALKQAEVFEGYTHKDIKLSDLLKWRKWNNESKYLDVSIRRLIVNKKGYFCSEKPITIAVYKGGRCESALFKNTAKTLQA